MPRTRQFPPSVKPGIPKEPSHPQGWECYSFGEILRVVKRKADLADSFEYQLVTAKRSRGGIVPRERLKGRQIKTKSQFFCKAGDFLISRRQIVHGACGLVPPNLSGALVSNEYSTLRTTEMVLPDFFVALSHTTYFQQTCFQSSIGVDVEKMIFKLDDWLRFKVALPPLREQVEIIKVLSSVDEAIQSTRAVIKQTRRVKEGLLQNLLTKGIGHHRFKETQVGEIPESWVLKRLADLASVRSGIAKNTKRSLDDPITVPYLRVANVQDGYLDLAEVKKIEIENMQLDRYRLQPGDVLMNEGGDIDKLGRGDIWRGQIDPCVHQNHVFSVRCGPLLLPEYLSYLAESNIGKQYFLASGKQTTNLASINKTQLRAFPIPLPPRSEQEEIVGRLDAVRATEERNRSQAAELTTLKSGLLQDLLTGKVRVKV